MGLSIPRYRGCDGMMCNRLKMLNNVFSLSLIRTSERAALVLLLAVAFLISGTYFGLNNNAAVARTPSSPLVEPDVSVLVLSMYSPKSVRLFAESSKGFTVKLGADRWQAKACGVSLDGKMLGIRCGASESQQYSAITVEDVQGNIGIEIPGKIKRRFRGSISIQADVKELKIINRLPLEKYLVSVVASELDSNQPAAMQAQAVLARTWALKHGASHGVENFCDLTHCQNYTGVDGETNRAAEAVRRTEGMVVTYKDMLIEPYYHSTSGGKTTTPDQVWGGESQPYLVSVPDDFCSASPHYRWTTIFTPSQRHQLEYEAFKGVMLEMKVLERTRDDRVAKILIKTSTGDKVMTGNEFYRLVGKTLDWNLVKSEWFFVDSRNGRFIINGRGLGHGVGMSQWGAIGLSSKGRNYKQIIEYYFQGVEVRRWDGESQRLH